MQSRSGKDNLLQGIPVPKKTAHVMVTRRVAIFRCWCHPAAAGHAVGRPGRTPISPASIVAPTGQSHRIKRPREGLRVAANDGAKLSNFKNELPECGRFLHHDTRDVSSLQRSFARTNSARNAFVACTVIIAFSAAASRAAFASSCSD